MDDLPKQGVESFALGETHIEPEWAPAFLVHKLIVSITPGYVPVVKSKLVRKFFANYTPLRPAS